jgi:hypothetical protein
MKTYNATRTYSFKDLIRETSVTIIVITIIFAIVLLWFPERLTIFSLVVPAILLLKDFYDKASRRRLQQLTFDSDKNEVVVFFKSLLSNVKQIRLSFDAARLEVVEEKGKLKIFEPLTLYLMKEKMEVFELTKSKDLLTVDTLQDIVRTAEDYAIPIIYK